MLSNATNRAAGRHGSVKKKQADRRGLSEIKRSEAALSERNAGLEKEVAALKKKLAVMSSAEASTIARTAQLEQELTTMKEMVTALEVAKENAVADVKGTLEETHAHEKSEWKAKVASLGRALEKAGYDAISMEKVEMSEQAAIAETTHQIDDATATIEAHCAEHRERCALILEQLNQATAKISSLALPAVPLATTDTEAASHDATDPATDAQ
mmetsp:Transcript_23165/g.60573  ORF Transcript_23165/g.60573 Transcript_23165/m.60573 type:complete len:213 (+) Transcript_23165:49-687(+)